MLRSQRFVLIVGLALIAFVLHTNTCEWRWRTTERDLDPLIVLWRGEYARVGTNLLVRPITGLLVERELSVLSGLLLGVVGPLALLTAAAFLALGWRYQERVNRGLCTACGYDLRGQSSPRPPSPPRSETSRCPECGSVSSKASD